MRLARVLALPLLLAPLACPRAPHVSRDPRAPCASLDAVACRRARALAEAASTYADEQHDYVLAGSPLLASGVGIARTKEGWRPLPLPCARSAPSESKLDASAVQYGFVGVAIDGTLLSADADIGPLLAAGETPEHVVRLVALAFVRDLAPASFDRGASLVESASGACTCGDATHFAGARRYGALLSYDWRIPRGEAHGRAIDFVRAALGDERYPVRETRAGELAIAGLDPLLAGEAAAPLTFRVSAPTTLAYAASPLQELCDFPAPEVSPSPLDFGVAPYGTEARRTVHVVNRAAVDLRALVGASTYVLPAHGALDLSLRWTPDGDAPACETQTRDEAIPFMRLSREASAPTPRTARVLETIRTGRPSVQRVERVEALGPRPDYATTARDWTCPRDFARTACRAESSACADGHGCTSGGYALTAEPSGENGCHFACRGPTVGAPHPFCRFDAVMVCALHCPP